ncbi:carbon monoxide dehydrogenase [Halobacteriales archaeon QS_8_69_26]|nr:MAG: carbon monoxide dehydrogenase [Halobacteriales archaeon QS_8_69_26]
MSSDSTDATPADPDAADAEGGDLVGSRVERKEDRAHLTGRGTYTDDLEVPGAAHLSVLRSQYGHARIEDVDTSAAEAMDGVVAVYTYADMRAARTPAPRKIPTISTYYIEISPERFRPILATDRVRYQGDPIAVAVAEDRYTAHDAVDAIEVDYERLEAVNDPEAALADDAPTLYEDMDDNLAFEWEMGDRESVDRTFEAADHTVGVAVDEQRLIPNPIETRAAVAEYEPGTDRLTIRMGTQTPHSDRHAMSGILQHPENKIHVVVPDVGGGFGAKIHNYDVESAVAWCARELERPVRWRASRAGTHQAGSHGRGLSYEGEMALSADGDIEAVRAEGLADVGGYVASHVHVLCTKYSADLLAGQYDVPEVYAHVQGALTNATPLDSYRGVMEVSSVTFLERLVSAAADELGMDPAELRRRNFVPPEAFPYESATGLEYDSGDYEAALDTALEAAGYEDLRERQERLREENRYLGIGLSSFAHVTGLGPGDHCKESGIFKTHWESSRVTVHPSGTVTAYCGTQDFGMSHRTIYAQIVADELGVDFEDIEVVEGDTRQVNDGVGTHASRSAVVGGGSIAKSAAKVREQAREVAAHELEAAPEDVTFEDGEFRVKGAPERSLSMDEVASVAHRAYDVPDDPGLEATTYYEPEDLAITNGTHIAVVEADGDTGELAVVDYVAVTDAGTLINPTVVEGQIQGGVIQGIGQAVLEGVEYDDNGNLVTGSLMDYAMPRAHQVPDVETVHLDTPAPNNPTGAKGVGETGPIAANPAVVNAVCDALAPLGYDGTDVETPYTDRKVWEIIHGED